MVLMSTAKSNHNPAAIAIAKRQHVFDFLFKHLTQSFALIVLFALLGIILSLIINAYPALNKFGFGTDLDKMPDEVFKNLTTSTEKGGSNLRQFAKELTGVRRKKYMDGRLGMIIDGTGDDYKKIYDSLTTENDKVKRMLASKQFYKDHPDLKPERKAKKQRQNYDSLSYLKELHGDKLVDMISKSNDENYNVNFKNGKIMGFLPWKWKVLHCTL